MFRISLLLVLSLIGISLLAVAQTTAPSMWQAHTAYGVGAPVSYGTQAYRCLQAHTSQIGWEPPTTPALWSPTGTVSGGGTGTCGAAPGVPGTPVASSVTSSSVGLTWAASNVGANCPAATYTVYRNGTAVATTSGTNYTVTGLSAATAYQFTVAAADSVGSSVQSAGVAVTTSAAGGGTGGSGCAAAWSAAAVYTGNMTASVNGTNYKANWWTQGQNPAANSGPAGSGQPWTVVGVCAACATLPGAPTGLQLLSNAASTSASLTWTAPVAPANCSLGSYTVYRNGVAAGTTTGLSDTVTGLTPQTTYSFTVAASDGAGSSAQSAALSVTTAGGSSTPPPPPGGKQFAPYVDMGLTSAEQLVSIQQQTGVSWFTLAFIISNGGCTPRWGGVGTLASDTLPNGTTIRSLVSSLRAAGANVIVSFGGANGTELAQACSDVPSLQAAYQAVIDQYGLTSVDFDVEGAAVADQASVDRRNQALVRLKAANPGLTISYTLPVLPTGLIASGVNVLNSIHAAGLTVNVINIMAMDYGASVDNGGQMGLDATLAADATAQQIQTAGLTASLGITPMIGVNDTNTEVFSLADAQTLLNYANTHANVARLAMWSMGRDNGSCAGAQWASATCSGLTQSTYQFSSLWGTFR